jgi:transcriptional regulator with XRE-family HTH domain
MINYRLMGAKIRRARKRMRLTQEALAERVDMSAAFVGHIERGTRKPSLETIGRICKATGLSSDYLLGLTVK